MTDKQVSSMQGALDGVKSGDTVLVGGFGDSGVPMRLLDALSECDVGDLTVVCNNAGTGESGVAALFRNGQVRRIVCSYPRQVGAVWFEKRYRAGDLELELVPQGTLSERIRAAGAGIGAFYTPTAAGTELGAAKEVRSIEGRDHVLEFAISADLALVKAAQADRWGNLTYRGGSRNFNPTMAMAGRLTIAEVDAVVPLGAIDPEHVVTPGIFVDRVVCGSEST